MKSPGFEARSVTAGLVPHETPPQKEIEARPVLYKVDRSFKCSSDVGVRWHLLSWMGSNSHPETVPASSCAVLWREQQFALCVRSSARGGNRRQQLSSLQPGLVIQFPLALRFSQVCGLRCFQYEEITPLFKIN